MELEGRMERVVWVVWVLVDEGFVINYSLIVTLDSSSSLPPSPPIKIQYV
jgi:hypothetical protein